MFLLNNLSDSVIRLWPKWGISSPESSIYTHLIGICETLRDDAGSISFMFMA